VSVSCAIKCESSNPQLSSPIAGRQGSGRLGAAAGVHRVRHLPKTRCSIRKPVLDALSVGKFIASASCRNVHSCGSLVCQRQVPLKTDTFQRLCQDSEHDHQLKIIDHHMNHWLLRLSN
jgi:hypothetical protein